MNVNPAGFPRPGAPAPRHTATARRQMPNGLIAWLAAPGFAPCRTGSAWIALLFVFLAAVTHSSGCNGEEAWEPCAPENAITVEVESGGDSASVALGLLHGTEDGDLCTVGLADVVEAADLGFVMAESRFDFEGADGFRPSDVECEPLDATTISQGSMDRVTGTLVWPVSMGLRGCYSVSQVHTIHVIDSGR